MTNPDGNEHSTVVWVDHAIKPRVEKIVRDARASVEAFLGPRGGEALLALLAESVLGQSEDLAEPTVVQTAKRKEARHA